MAAFALGARRLPTTLLRCLGRASSGSGRRSLVVIGLLVLGLTSCSVRRTFRASPGPYDKIDAVSENRLRVARDRMATGDLERAEAVLVELADEHRQHVPTWTLLQEVRLKQLIRGGSTVEEAEADLAKLTRKLALERDDVVPWVLLARLAETREEAEESLDRAAAIDPRCVWVSYARAWWSFRDRDFKAARQHVDEAFALDGGHLETLRLYSRLAAGGSDSPLAINALEVWIRRAAESARVRDLDIARAELDLAALYMLEERPDDALDVLTILDLDLFDERERARAELVRAAAFDDAELGRLALRAATRANELDPDDLMPYVHRALLLEDSDPVEAEAAWKALLELAEAQRVAASEADEDRGFQPLLLELRARYAVARAERDRLGIE